MPESRPLVGLIGYARSGKDTFAAELGDHHGYRRIGFADPLKQAALAIDPLIDRDTHLSEIVMVYGWEFAKDTYPEVRRLLQNIGEGMRRVLGETVWLDLAMNKVASTDRPVVITDVRYRNEARAITEAGGTLVRITRPGVGPVNGHTSETELADYPTDLTVANDGAVDQLRENARAVHARITS